MLTVKLKASIEELNQKGRERLMDAFSKANRKLNDVFIKLFGGGSAKLELVDSDDPLDAGLEMLVSPPGKKITVYYLIVWRRAGSYRPIFNFCSFFS